MENTPIPFPTLGSWSSCDYFPYASTNSATAKPKKNGGQVDESNKKIRRSDICGQENPGQIVANTILESPKNQLNPIWRNPNPY